MQHYGAPTRLLDFTYSPYVALYFALRLRQEQSDFIEVWAINPTALLAEADKVFEADGAPLTPPRKKGPISLSPVDAESLLQAVQREEAMRTKAIAAVLNPNGLLREYCNQNGFVTLAIPPVQNARLSSQQGVFLFNGAEHLTFEGSLELMMEGVKADWYHRFRIPSRLAQDAEKQLLSYNIHDLSLFPDVEGLAGWVRQRLKLHW
jgi:hypothetical protein